MATSSKRQIHSSSGVRHGQWRILEMISGVLLVSVGVLLVCIFTPLGDSMAETGLHALTSYVHEDGDTPADPRHRQQMIALVEAGKTKLKPCSPRVVSADHTPCEDPRLSSHLPRDRNFYRERHCPSPDQTPLCLVPPPPLYRSPIPWPQSLLKIWYNNMPHSKIAERKGHQGWMKKDGPYFIFPGGGTMFPDGAIQYIQKLAQYIPLSGGTIRTALDVGCGVASFGGYSLKEGILTMSFAPRDSHKSQIQFALERGIPAFLAMLGTHRLPFPAHAFDMIHCSRCLIPFTAYNGSYLIEMDRLLRPGGYLVISGPPVQWPKKDEEWSNLQNLAQSLCYEMLVVAGTTAIWKKPTNISCLAFQKESEPKLCDGSSDPNAAWQVALKECVSWIPVTKERDHSLDRLSKWPDRLDELPQRAIGIGNYVDVYKADIKRWKRRVSYYRKKLGLKLGSSSVRNVMDMNAGFGSFAAAIISDPVWVMNVVPSQKRNTLGAIYDRGLIGVYHDWCEAFSTYPRTYDFIHVVEIESLIKGANGEDNRCSLVSLLIEIDRVLRPEGTVLIRDSPNVIQRVKNIAKAIRWSTEVHKTEPESSVEEYLLVARKQFWTLSSI